MNLQKKIKIGLAVFLGIGFLLLTFVIYPLFEEIKKSSEELLLARQELAFIEEKTKQAPLLKEKFLAFKSDLEKIQKLFVDPEAPINFLQFLEKTAKNCNVVIDISLLPTREKEVVFFPFLSFRLSLIGSFPNCMKFLEKLEMAPYLIEIKDLTTRRLTEDQLKSEKYKEFSLGDVEFYLLIKVFANGSTSSPQVGSTNSL